MAPCPDEETLVRFASGQLGDGDELSRLEAHLQTCSACCTVVGALAPSSTLDELPSPFIRRGASVGRYLILDTLGAGGMGVVYAAFDPDLDRKVALKLLHGGFAEPSRSRDAQARLAREAQAMARLSHPNVIAVHDVGTFGERVFVTMELVEGASLQRWLAEELRSWRDVREIFLAAGRGLAAAHEAGIVHRDFKPDNVLVGRDGRVRVTDFGLASPARTLSEGDPLPTEGGLLGTPCYMASEQLLGKVPDARADQFSFCVALYEAWYGRRPFAGETLARLREEVLGERVEPEPKGSKVPLRLRRALRRGLRADPEARWPSMEELLEALSWDPAARRIRWAVAAIAVVLLAVAVLGARFLALGPKKCQGANEQLAEVWDGARSDQVHQAFLKTGKVFAEDAFRAVDQSVNQYQQAWAAMHVEACEATRVRGHQSDEVLGLRMACLDRDLKQLKALTALFSEADEQIVQNAAQAANGLPDLRACADVDALLAPLKAPSDSKAQQVINQVRGNLARAQALLDSGRYAQSAEIAAKAASDAKELRFAPLQAEALLLEGNAQVEAGQYKDAAAKLFSAALAAEAGHHKQVEARAYLRLVRVVGSLQWRIEEAKIFSSLAEATIAQAGESTELSGELEEARGELAYYGQGRPEEAFGHVDRALTLLKKALGSEHPRVIWMHNFVGWIHADLGHLDEALAHMQEALAIRERNLGPRHPEVGKGLFNLALVRLARGETDEALALHLRALELWTQALGPDHPLVLRALAGIAEVKAEQGHDLEAEQALASLIPRMTQVMGRENPRLVEALITRGEALLRLGRADEAEQLLQQALDGEIKASGPDHPWQSAPMVGLAEVALVKKDPARAIDLAEHAISLLGEGSRRDLGAARFALARALDEKGRHDEATKAGIQARDDLRLTAPRSRKLRDLEAWLSKKGTP